MGNVGALQVELGVSLIDCERIEVIIEKETDAKIGQAVRVGFHIGLL